eukprot:TRINITY_DN57460_c0_g1_i1.p1 TRINITY_DN57460_c0_g1~~TRINITY_DN57460_c0_g1_i1.p1  ORF type:complete len:279 (+),score=32.45 TRINITY_DN57460_c0_g1_i1:72-908(+)
MSKRAIISDGPDDVVEVEKYPIECEEYGEEHELEMKRHRLSIIRSKMMFSHAENARIAVKKAERLQASLGIRAREYAISSRSRNRLRDALAFAQTNGEREQPSSSGEQAGAVATGNIGLDNRGSQDTEQSSVSPSPGLPRPSSDTNTDAEAATTSSSVEDAVYSQSQIVQPPCGQKMSPPAPAPNRHMMRALNVIDSLSSIEIAQLAARAHMNSSFNDEDDGSFCKWHLFESSRSEIARLTKTFPQRHDVRKACISQSMECARKCAVEQGEYSPDLLI